ncbi:PHT4, partial [Symbiodinium sp. CCMP2456]
MDDCVPPAELAGCRCGRRGCPGDAWDATDMTKPIIIKESTAAGFMAFLQGLCPKARGLCLRQRRHPFALPLCALPAALPGLRQLRITADLSSFWDSSEVFGQVAGNLEELVLEDPALRSQSQFRLSGLAKLRTLRRLRLHLQHMVSYSDLLLLATGCQCLEELSLPTLEMPSGSGLLQGEGLFRKLRCFKMLRQSNAIVDAAFLASVWRLCPSLQTLWVLQCAGRRLCYREVLAVCQLVPGLTSLVVLPEVPSFKAPSAKLERSIAALRQADIDLGDPCSPLFREEYTQHEWVELLRRRFGRTTAPSCKVSGVRDDTTSDGETDGDCGSIGEGWPNEETGYEVGDASDPEQPLDLGERMTDVRATQAYLVAGSRLMSYLCRAQLGVLLPTLTMELQLSSSEQGYLMSRYANGYLATQVLGGIIADRLGGYGVMLFCMLASGVCCFLAPALMDFGSFAFGTAFVALGVLQGMVFPAGSVVCTQWLLPSERSWASSISAIGSATGLLLCNAAGPPLVANFGWKAVLYLTGACCFGFSVAWAVLAASSPKNCGRASSAELAMLEKAGVLDTGREQPKSASPLFPPLAFFTQPCVAVLFLAHFA